MPSQLWLNWRVKSMRDKPNKNCCATIAQIKSVAAVLYPTPHHHNMWNQIAANILATGHMNKHLLSSSSLQYENIKSVVTGRWLCLLISWRKKKPLFELLQYLTDKARIRFPSSPKLLNKQQHPFTVIWQRRIKGLFPKDKPQTGQKLHAHAQGREQGQSTNSVMAETSLYRVIERSLL